MNTFTFDLVTPQATFFSGQARLVEAPGTLGEFGVLAGHMPFISTLQAGVVTVHDDKEALSRLFVAGGLAEVNPKSCTILAEQVVDLNDFTLADAEERLAKAIAHADNVFDEDAKLVAAQDIVIAEALLKAMK